MCPTHEGLFQTQTLMAAHNELGAQGEYEALLYLTKQGYTLLAHNWRVGHLELDIVAEQWGEIVFVEVKTRSSEDFAPAAEAVTLYKKRNLIAAARAYLARNGLLERPYRYDIITVVGKAQPFKLTHLRNAYTEEGVYLEHSGRKGKAEFQV
ncbi:MAG: YraN family protein [Prevotellamassilia sp.]|jgi:putative endonuclease|nr:YraN family protein [Prevotellamassilia sp.]